MGEDFGREEVLELFHTRTFPQIKIDDVNIDGYTELEKWSNEKL